MMKFATHALAFAALATVMLATSPAPATSTPASPTVPATAPASTVTPLPSATEELPPTPGPPTPTPRLPEEGGPPGGVLGGHVYIDNDGSRTFSAGDGTTGGTVLVDALDSAGNVFDGYSSASDTTGAWQLRALPDGIYRVRWDPYLPESQWPLTIPPVQTINLVPEDTVHDNVVHVITTTVEIRGANRILGIDFGIPPQPPVPGARLPSTGTGSEASRASLAVLALGFGLALSGAAWLSLRGRSRARSR